MASQASFHNTFSFLDYFVFGIFLVASASIGALFGWRGRKSKNNKEFLTGNRNLSMFPVVMSLAASFMSTNTILGVPAEVYTLGTQLAIHLIPFCLAVALSAEVFMPIFYELNMTSVNEYLGMRFQSGAVRLAGSAGFVFCTLPYMAVVLYGPSLALSSVTDLPVAKSILVVGIICTFYTSIGGIKAVIWTDVLQCILMIVCLLLVIFNGWIESGLIEPFRIANDHGRLKFWDFGISLYRNDTATTIFLGSIVGWCGCYCISQTEVQRFCSTKSHDHAKRTLYWNIPPVVLIALTAIYCGIIIFAKYHGCDPISMGIIERTDQLMPYYVMQTMAKIPGIPGLFTAGVFSGALSTLSSGFNSLAAVTWDDYLQHKFSNPDKSGAHVTKIIAAIYGVLAISLSFVVGRLGTVLQASIAISGAIRGPLFGLFCLGIFLPFTNKKGALSGMITGFLVSITIAFGSIVSPRPKAQLPFYTDQCSADTYQVYGYKNATLAILPWEYEPTGFNKIAHISYFYVPMVGFLITMITGSLISLLTGCNGGDTIDPKLMFHFRTPSFIGRLLGKGGKLTLNRNMEKVPPNSSGAANQGFKS